MFVSIRKYVADSPDEITKLVNDGFLPVISSAQGFMAYYGLKGDGGVWTSISVFESREGAEESNRMAAEWIKKNAASLKLPPPEVISGEVVTHTSKAAGKTAGR